MYFLSLETSTKTFSIALSCDEKVLRFRNIKSAFCLENAVLPAIDKILAVEGLTLNQMDGFAIALGPGSFTSLRVGLASVKALSFALRKPVVGIASLDIIAHGTQRYPDSALYNKICVLQDARRGKVYAAVYEVKGPIVRPCSDYLLTTLEDVLARLDGKTLFTGDALGLYRKDIEKKYRQGLFADEPLWYPQAKVMARLAFERFGNKQYDDAASLVPLYLYAQDCQVTPPMAGSSPNVSIGDP